MLCSRLPLSVPSSNSQTWALDLYLKEDTNHLTKKFSKLYENIVNYTINLKEKKKEITLKELFPCLF